MSPEERKLLEEAVTLSRENHKILRQLRGSLWWGRVYSLLKWVVIIGSTIWAYYYIQPYLFQLMDTYEAMRQQIDEVRKASGQINANLPDLSGLLNGLGE